MQHAATQNRIKSTSDNDFFDIIIIGGGLVGAGLAAALRDTDLRIALVDARIPSNEDPRLFALNSSSCQFLENLGLWPQLSPYAAPIHQVHVSYQRHFGAVRLCREDVQLSSLGHVIPARYIEAALNEQLVMDPADKPRDDAAFSSNALSAGSINTQRRGCFTLIRPATLKSLQQQNQEAELIIDTKGEEKIIRAALVIGADGTESTVRKQLNIAADVFDYEQSAIVTRTILKRSHESIAYERFTALGAIAMLPLQGNECATIISAKSDSISHLMTLSDVDFLQVLQKEFGYRLGRFEHIGRRHVFPLQMVRAEKMVDGCVFLLGNAAHTLHPIAAQGFNLALYEVATLAEGILEKVRQQEEVTAADLQKMSEKTQKQQAASIGMSHRLSRLFSADSLLVNLLLQMGMVFFDVATPVKKRFIKGMIGRMGRVPSLLMSTNEL